MTSGPQMLHGKCIGVAGNDLVLEDGSKLALEGAIPSDGTVGQTVLDMLVAGKNIAYIIASASQKEGEPPTAYVWADTADVSMIVAYLANECT